MRLDTSTKAFCCANSIIRSHSNLYIFLAAEMNWWIFYLTFIPSFFWSAESTPTVSAVILDEPNQTKPNPTVSTESNDEYATPLPQR